MSGLSYKIHFKQTIPVHSLTTKNKFKRNNPCDP